MDGHCSCGAVHFENVKPTLWCSHCHCTMCQAAHGAGIVTWVGCEESAVKINDEDHTLRWFKSSADAERGFCSRCGSPIFFRSTQWPGELHIARALFTGEIDRAPANHSFYDTHVEWMKLHDELPGRN